MFGMDDSGNYNDNLILLSSPLIVPNDEDKTYIVRFSIEGTGKDALSSMEKILLEIKDLQERIVPIEINNVPESQILKLEKRIQRVLDESPEYLAGKFILKTPYSEHKGRICGKIFAALDDWNGGDASQDSIMITNQNQYRAPDISWRQIPLNIAQCNNSRFPRPMPDLWIEICYNRLGDRNAVLEKIQAHLPSQSTVFVMIVLANKISEAMRQRLGAIGRQSVAPTISATGSMNVPQIGPYMAVWTLGSTDATYYNVHRGHYIDLQLVAHPPNPAPVFRFDMDLICKALQL
jgi:hypothetical protein